MKCRMAIIILNYMNYEDTKECIQCALNQKGIGYEIIVVDNGSSNDSFDILKKEYDHVPNITILGLDKNLGFAKGNNYGINYARKKFKADYVFVCNSDVTFTEDLFEKALELKMKGIGAISPPVIDNEGNPQPLSITTNNIYIKIINTIIQMVIVWITFIPLISNLYKIYHSKKITEQNIQKTNLLNPNKYNLQGCAFFLTPEFFKYYESLYPNTFLYWEEINLIVYLSKVRLQAVIKELPEVIHKGKKSTIHLIKNKSYEKKRLAYSTKSLMKSLPMFFRSYVYILAKYN